MDDQEESMVASSILLYGGWVDIFLVAHVNEKRTSVLSRLCIVAILTLNLFYEGDWSFMSEQVLASHTYSGLRTWVASTPQLQNLHLFSRTVHNLHSHSNASKVTIAANLGWRKCNSSSHSIVSTWRPLAQGPASRNFMNTRLAITMKDSLRDHLLSATQSTRVCCNAFPDSVWMLHSDLHGCIWLSTWRFEQWSLPWKRADQQT